MKKIIILIILLSNISYAQDTKNRIAVLDIKSNVLSEQEKAFYTEIIRTHIVPIKDLMLITRENIMTLLPPNTSLEECIGVCEVETGRKIGARFIITSEVLKVKNEYCFYIKIHDVTTSEVLDQDHACHENDNLKIKIEKLSNKLIASLFKKDSYFYSTPDYKNYNDTNELFLINFSIKPADAEVFVNGIQHKKNMYIAKGKHTILIKRKDYYTLKKVININKDEEFSYELKPKFGNLYIFDEILVKVNGKKQKTPLHIKTKKGKKYKIEIFDKCYKHQNYEIILKEGESKIINPIKRKVKVTISSENIFGEQIKGKVFAGSSELGVTPLEKYIWVCNDTLRLRYKDKISIFKVKNLDKESNRNIIFKVKTKDSFTYNKVKTKDSFIYKQDNELLDINDDKQVIKRAIDAHRKTIRFNSLQRFSSKENARYSSKEYTKYALNSKSFIKTKDDHFKHSFYATILTSSFLVAGLGLYNLNNCNEDLSLYCKKDAKYYASSGILFIGLTGMLTSGIYWAYDYKCHWLTGFQKYKSCPKERKKFSKEEKRSFDIMLMLYGKKTGSVNLSYKF